MWHSGIVLSIQRLKVCHFKNVDEGKDHYVKWNKPSIESKCWRLSFACGVLNGWPFRNWEENTDYWRLGEIVGRVTQGKF